ncbi:hypothetical protein [Halorussus sp. MSC15.2]|uniref:hypothetical protein n=1 Tax=Halorussus sp. MSC15.2 TaxID=2283638 RepID=UPI0013D11604|nr:hypothetical protein [Halorussus sp. MSC15.2]NEU55645.1 hypothetical protein [Halorussus sp. MSC15.2]
MTTDTRRIADDSTVVGFVRTTVLRLRAWFTASWVASTVGAITNALEVATDTSGLAGIVRVLARWTRCSLLYRWLTTESEPDVVVVNLRDTYTVGPLVALLDRLVPHLERTWRASFVSRATGVLRNSAESEWVRESRTVRLLLAVLEPPESPDEDQRT